MCKLSEQLRVQMQCEFVELGCFEVKELKTWKEGIIHLQWGEGSISDRTNTFRAQEDFTVNYHTVGTTHIDYSLLNYYILLVFPTLRK